MPRRRQTHMAGEFLEDRVRLHSKLTTEQEQDTAESAWKRSAAVKEEPQPTAGQSALLPT